MCSFKIPIAGQHVAILTGFTNTQTVGTVQQLYGPSRHAQLERAQQAPELSQTDQAHEMTCI